MCMRITRKVKDVEFYDYCKGVLPNEWYSTWNEESLKAGAQAVKFVSEFSMPIPPTAFIADVHEDTSDPALYTWSASESFTS